VSDFEARVASALNGAVPVADGALDLREGVEMRLLTAGWMGASGADADVCTLLERTVQLAGGLDGGDVGLRLAVEAQLAYFLYRSGRREEGRAGCERVLAERLSVLGSDHLDTLTSRHMMAYMVGFDGDVTAARDLLARLTADRERVLGADHFATLATRHDHAYYVGEAGNRAAARRLFAMVAAGRERVLGPDHPLTLVSRYQQACCADRAGDPAAAAIISAEVLERAHGKLGPVERATVESRSLFIGLAGARAPSQTLLVGDGPQLRAAAEATLRLNSTIASELLAAWCQLAHRLEGPSRTDVLARVVEMAIASGRAPELVSAMLRALPAHRDADRASLTAAWLAAIDGRDELAVAHRMLRAASAAIVGDATAMLALPAEEHLVVETVLAACTEAVDGRTPG
jgi:hypothetical protein